jgi:hypothetical protein
MSAPRDKLWYLLNDPLDELAKLEVELDCIDIEIDGLNRIRYEENKARLERLGIDVSNYRPPPPRHRSEQLCVNHIGPDDDIEAIVAAAQESELDRVYREHLERKSSSAARGSTSSRDAADENVIYGPPGAVLRRPGGQILGVR